MCICVPGNRSFNRRRWFWCSFFGKTVINNKTTDVALKWIEQTEFREREMDFLKEQTEKGTMDSVFLVKFLGTVTIEQQM